MKLPQKSFANLFMVGEYISQTLTSSLVLHSAAPKISCRLIA